MTNSPRDEVFTQRPFGVCLEWGERGAQVLAPTVDVLIIVDVLSFTTAVDVATARGATVFPYRSRDAAAATFADHIKAVLAVDRLRVSADHPFSLSPTTLVNVSPGTRLVLPSLNGAEISLLAAGLGPIVVAGCLRNAAAVANAARTTGGRIGVIPAGERWRDGALRPAFEDLVGAGAIISHLPPNSWSPEAEASVFAFRNAASTLQDTLHACVSGRELSAMGFARDVAIAGVLDASTTVPTLSSGAYEAT
jgi:2-phosphosulfolactate phosphatase